MKQQIFRRGAAIAAFLLLLGGVATAAAQDYAALQGVKGLTTVVDYTVGSPEMALVVLPAIRQIYQDKSVTALPNPPKTVIVFHGEATKLLSTDRKGFAEKEHATLEKVASLIREMKQDGVKMEVCMYAVDVLDIDPATLLPEIDRVGNGFISVAGYQQQGYSLVAVP